MTSLGPVLFRSETCPASLGSSRAKAAERQ